MVYLIGLLQENDTFELIKSYQIKKKEEEEEIVLGKFQLTDLTAESTVHRHTKHISTHFSWSHKTANIAKHEDMDSTHTSTFITSVEN
jgi:hypothetical protein